jgi:hypothetical protein
MFMLFFSAGFGIISTDRYFCLMNGIVMVEMFNEGLFSNIKINPQSTS